MVHIELNGRGNILGCIENIDDLGDLIEFGMITEDLEVWANDEDITDKIMYDDQSYIQENMYLTPEFPRFFRKVGGLFEFHSEFDIDVEPEDFDPEKLLIIRSEDELEFMDYGLAIDEIIYDGQEISIADDYEQTFYEENFDFPMSGINYYQVDKMPM